MNRDVMRERLRGQRGPFDVVVVGGGATGCGVAVDAASRGYSVLLVEAFDFGQGTSSRSTKLVHGGVRYLAQGRISLVREALRERAILRRNAPHLVSVLSILVPAANRYEAARFTVGLKLYDLLAGSESFGPSRYVSGAQMQERMPQIAGSGLISGTQYFDGQFDDARTVIALVRTAADHGTVALNYCPLIGFDKDVGGRIRGVQLRDTETGEELEVAARAVVNAAGPYSDGVRRLDQPAGEVLITPSQGAHVVVDRRFLPGQDALLIPKTPDGRIMFAIPWYDRVLLGTTETPLDDAPTEPIPQVDEVATILEVTSRYLADSPTQADVRSTFAGIRPLKRVSGRSSTAKASRRHSVVVAPSGLVSIVGGKWTTYRRMAEDCLNIAVRRHRLPERTCVTEELPLHGAATSPPRRDGLSKYGSDADDVRSLLRDRPELDVPLHPDLSTRAGECVWAARHELARTVADVLARRTSMLFLDARAAREAAPRVAALLAEELGRDSAWQAQQVAAFGTLAASFSVPREPVTPGSRASGRSRP